MKTLRWAVRALLRSPLRAALLVGVLSVSIGLALIMITVDGALRMSCEGPLAGLVAVIAAVAVVAAGLYGAHHHLALAVVEEGARLAASLADAFAGYTVRSGDLPVVRAVVDGNDVGLKRDRVGSLLCQCGPPSGVVPAVVGARAIRCAEPGCRWDETGPSCLL